MTVVKKVVLLVLALIAALIGPGFVYGLVTGRTDPPSWVGPVSWVAALAILIGGVVYIAVDAAQRHNR